MHIPEKYPLGSRPSIHYLPYLIFISYIVSLIGASTTVELLHRRVTGQGWRSWVQLAACSVSFGLVAIWCMHFVGNRAIVLGDGEKEIQLYYSPTYTAVSAILPIIVIFPGFLVGDRFYKGSRSTSTRYLAMIVCGVLTGASVTEMHYLGNQGTTDYILKPRLGFIIGAATIAIGACCLAFGLFFHWAGHWMNTLWRRLIVSCFLAGAVSGMHWTAAAGTSYELRGYHQGAGTDRNVTLIIALCLSLSACVVCFGLGFMKQRRTRKLKDRAQQVVLALATFDKEGRLLVTQSGLMPCQTITRQFHQRTFDEDFNTTHPVFHWIYRVSRHWGGISDLIPSMRDHLQSTGYLQNNAIGGGSRFSFSVEDNSSYSTTFRELFCVTAQDIARSMDTRIQDLGCLYEDVLTTGTLLNRTFWRDTHGHKNILAADVATTSGDIEAGIASPVLFGKGQLLVLTRKVGTEEANRLQNNGYRFASMDQIGDPLSRSMQIPRDDLNLLIARLQLYCQREAFIPTEGTYLASFLLQPSPTMKGLDVIVPRATPDRLPMVRLSSEELKPSQRKLLTQFNGLTLEECVNRIKQRANAESEEDMWLEKFRGRVLELLREVPEPCLQQAVFSSQPLSATHGNIITGQIDGRNATIFAFCGIKEVNNQTLQSRALRCVPLGFFKTQQRVYPGCPDHGIFAHKNHKEFSTLLQPAVLEQPSHSRSRSRWGKWPIASRTMSVSEQTLNPDSSSEKGLVNISQYASTETTNTTSHPWGGIMVSQDIVINGNQKDNNSMEMTEMGLRSEAGVQDKEQQTIADKLMTITTSFRDPYNKVLRDNYNRR